LVPIALEDTMINRRNLLKNAAISTAAATTLLGSSAVHSATDTAAVGDNGLHVQDWFLESFLDLKDDRLDAAANGKSLAILFEQRGCPYCAEMHRVNFARKEITDYIKANFDVLQVDLWGSREMTDFDGEQLPEKKLGRKWRVNFTPTIVFIKPGIEDADPSEMEVARIPGYFKPFHFISMFEFVAQKKYDEMPFQRFLQARFKALEEKGLKPNLW
jgi:thioredoxin-related protein